MQNLRGPSENETTRRESTILLSGGGKKSTEQNTHFTGGIIAFYVGSSWNTGPSPPPQYAECQAREMAMLSWVIAVD